MPQHLNIDLGDGRESETPLEGMSGGCRVPAQTLVRREALLSMCSAKLLGRSRIRLQGWSQSRLEGPGRFKLVSGTNWELVVIDRSAVWWLVRTTNSSLHAVESQGMSATRRKKKGEVETEVINKSLCFHTALAGLPIQLFSSTYCVFEVYC